MTPVTIPLNFRRSDFEAIYFRENYHLVFKNPNTRNQALLTIAVAAIWIAVGIKLLVSGGNQTIFIVVSIMLAITAARLKRRTDSIKRWKNEIDRFLGKLDEPATRTLVLSTEGFSFLEEKEEEKVELWSEVVQADIETDYISINAKVDYLFPKAAMTAEEFERLAGVVSRFVD